MVQKQFNGEKTVFSINAVEQLDIIDQKKFKPKSHFLYKNELKMDHWSKCKTIILLKETTEEFHDLGLGRVLTSDTKSTIRNRKYWLNWT